MSTTENLLLLGAAGAAGWYFFLGPGKAATAGAAAPSAATPTAVLPSMTAPSAATPAATPEAVTPEAVTKIAAVLQQQAYNAQVENAQQVATFLAAQPADQYQLTKAAMAVNPPTAANPLIAVDVRDYMTVDPSGTSLVAIPGVTPPPISVNTPYYNQFNNPATQVSSPTTDPFQFQGQVSAGSPVNVPESAVFKQYKYIIPVYIPPGGYTPNFFDYVAFPAQSTGADYYAMMKAWAITWWNQAELTKADWDWVLNKVASLIAPPELWNDSSVPKGPQTLDTYWSYTFPAFKQYGLRGLGNPRARFRVRARAWET